LSKIEVGYSKRKIVCIHFGCSLKKNRLGQSSLWKAAMAELNSTADNGSSLGRREERSRGHHRGSCIGGGSV
jgi:hypothetical protein